jgi:hypothetical protein
VQAGSYRLSTSAAKRKSGQTEIFFVASQHLARSVVRASAIFAARLRGEARER